MGAKPFESVMVGDTPADIRAGKALGTKTIAASYGWIPEAKLVKENPDAFAKKPEDIPALVSKLI